ncbi:MAG: glucosamine-6-phosphate deaminase [Planctomycetes bacterium]|nr:glucosamine-6-phosphate deaminase [Planctomycetota bacterium]
MSNRFEKLPVKIYEDNARASSAVAARIADLIRRRSAEGKKAVLGLATGHTPINVYRELIRLHKNEGLDFSNVITFNLDEYWPIQPDAFQSYHRWMNENFFGHVNIPKGEINIPAGTVGPDKVESFCRQYEENIRRCGGIDFQILGIGRTGHIGFNEPGSGRESRTRLVYLDAVTRKDAAGDFFGEENVPAQAISMGVGSILEGREIALLAFGEHKAPIVQRAIEGEISSSVAATFLQSHPACTFYLDEAAAACLARMATPWLLGSCVWDELLERKAVIWLSQKLSRPILKLTDEDYAENGLAELIHNRRGCYQLNIDAFKRLMNTITGWPGGKEKPKKVLILSPHPDDDVICMAGTMSRFVKQGHEVHVAYMVSGFLSVFDYDVDRFADFVRQFNDIFGLTPKQTRSIEEHIEKFLRNKSPGDIDSPEVQAVKILIRRTEAVAAAKFCGVSEANCHFLNMPFYNTGKVQKLPIVRQDVHAVEKILDEVKPDIIFAAGDMSDPHGTHRMCLAAAMQALEQYNKSAARKPELWLYRGAWQEWPVEQIDMAVPLAPDELSQKRRAIFRHQSQKDTAMFPGPYDNREFWQRAEDRNMASAKLYDTLGLPEYHAIEAFARWPIKRSADSRKQLLS